MTQPSRRKGGLGRGLASLIPTGPAEGDESTPRMGSAAADVVLGGGTPPPSVAPEITDDIGAVYREVDPASVEPNPRQPRQVFDEEALAELVHSIREFGLMQPIVVRELPEKPGKYQLVMGERRWRAAQQAGLTAVPAIVRETADDNLLRDALLENIHRVQLNPLEEASAYQQLLDEFGVTHDELASRIGRSRPLITNMIRLLRLPIAVQRRVAAGVLSAGHARALLALEAGPEAQEELAARIVAEGLSVRATEEAVTLANRADGPTPTAPRRKPIQMPGLQDVAERLSGAFDTRVTVSLGKRKGKIVVEFGSVDDLQRIVELMDQNKQ
ncbi:ParB/RepB/Spo0J family partition protein [Mycobacterium sp. ACS4331]|uniref:ParB/RepB/Spo0J family partition protein n=1 Tax=Mycobacterium sp. ACS4331 TaxID=1834121 RepID=UPI000800CFA8|nr:ParB/RepB/Spo0J family partition protein [Mycobacterium sp. ACS4331]OBF23107.1 chromosome partitioning protein ParB [Mycobacterium sp. ACS4331]